MSADKQDEPGFASRWSRLKREAKVEPQELESELQAGQEPDAPVEDDRSDEEVLAELDLPDPDSLKPGDNFAAFMAKAVPARLRNRALRRLWISDPVLANLDELIDYGEDFTDAATVIENLQTSYQVGKGFVDKAAEAMTDGDGSAEESEAEEPAAEEPGADAGAAADELGADELESDQANADNEAALEEANSGDLTELDAAEKAVIRTLPEPRRPVRQRMRFRVAEE